MKTIEDKAREMLDRCGVPDATSYSAGDLAEIANLIAQVDGSRPAETGVSWDYEEGPNYYHVYAACGHLDGLMEAWSIEVPQSSANDADVQQIVDCLNRMAARRGA